MARKTRKQKGRGQSVSRAIGIYDEELRTAITRGEISEVRKLIPYVDINKKDNTGKTALHLACRLPIYSRSSYDIVKLLLDNGAIIDSKDINNDTSLILVIRNINLRLIDLFIEKGADVNAIGYNGDTPLIVAVKKYFYTAVKRLIAKGANPEIENMDGNDALYYANNLRTFGHENLNESKVNIIDAINDAISRRAGRNLISVSRLGKNRRLPHTVEGEIGKYLSGVSGPLPTQLNRLKQATGISLAPRVKEYTKKRTRGNNRNIGNESNNNSERERARRRPGPTNGNNNNNMPNVNTFDL